MPGIRWFVTAATLITCVAAQAQMGPSLDGEWGPVLSWPSEVTHASLLANGKVLGWPPYHLGDNARVWDPATNTFVVSPKAGYNIFCTGHTHLADGRLLVAGGQIGAVLYGVPNASIYDPTTDTWTRLPDMQSPRWYPTDTTLANGDILVTSGQIDPVRGINGLPQIWQAATSTWQDLSSAQLIVPLYPRMFLA
ncbi:MAG TPA: kelch repeat-containing protein, partial [Candidatus Acidoferrum sp.]|nr:kelch repeat-containing protein [Candidatus Acidoferrum sp.]